jgi:hypothetical protein
MKARGAHRWLLVLVARNGYDGGGGGGWFWSEKLIWRSWTTEMARRDAPGCGEPSGDFGFESFFLKLRRGEAGEGGGVGEMQTTKLSSIRYTVKIPRGL